jgi:hypothetical protein
MQLFKNLVAKVDSLIEEKRRGRGDGEDEDHTHDNPWRPLEDLLALNIQFR